MSESEALNNLANAISQGCSQIAKALDNVADSIDDNPLAGVGCSIEELATSINGHVIGDVSCSSVDHLADSVEQAIGGLSEAINRHHPPILIE